MEKLLYYAAKNEKKAEQLSQLTRMGGMEFAEIRPGQSMQKLGYLAGIEGFSEEKPVFPAAAPAIPEELLIFCGISGGRLEDVLAMLRRSGLTVSLKAVLTPHNVNWTPAGLYRELCRERAALERDQKKEDV